MSALKDALREAADQAPSYPVVEAAIARGRRRRRASALTSAIGVLAIMYMAATLVAPLFDHRAIPVAEPASGSLPERIGEPGWFTADVPRPASLIFSVRARVISVGATNDTYWGFSAPGVEVGRSALLSPAGDQVAYWTDGAVVVVDLRSGSVRTYPVEDPAANTYHPAAWLPDGGGLVVLTVIPAEDPTTEGIVKRLALMDLSSGRTDTFAETTWPVALAGFAVAVSPDGRRIAYQYSNFVAVFDRTSRTKTNFQLPKLTRAVLAGKGAWTPDGRSLALLYRDTQRWDERRWELRLLDPTTGVERDPAYRPAMSGVGVMRLLGWNGRTGDPVVIAYHGPGTADGSMLAAGVNELLPVDVESVGLYELGPTGARTLVRPVDGIAAIDVADSVLAGGLTRPGDPPWAPSPLMVVAVVLGAIGVLALAGLFVARRRRRIPT